MRWLRELLKLTYQKRVSFNPGYSQNAFARDLGLSPAALSQFLSEKRMLAPKSVARVTEALGLDPSVIKESVDLNFSEFGLKLDLEIFSLIAKWYYFGILNLVEVDEINSGKDVSERLKISEDVANEALARLVELNFLTKASSYKRTGKALDAGTDIPSAALRAHNREKMELAIASLQTVPLEERDISSLTLTFDPYAMPAIKEEIAKFKKKINRLCQGGQAREVYSMNIQFFPLSIREV